MSQDDPHVSSNGETLHNTVRAAYAAHAATRWQVAETIYSEEELTWLPPGAITSALGLDHPVRAAHLSASETVLDLGCGGGIDTLLAARAVGPHGLAIGLDMTHEMIQLAQANAMAAGLANTHFLEGDMTAIPLPDSSVDVVISNGVFNLAADKDLVFAEARRVARPGGRLIVADMLLAGTLPESVRDDPRLWSG